MILEIEPNLPGNVLNALRQLGNALTHHSNWLNEFHRSLICDQPMSTDEMTANAHQKCLFGEWYYGGVDERIQALETFEEVGKLHQSVHRHANKLLKINQSGQAISAQDYDDFMNTAMRFRIALQDLQFKMVSQVCAVDHLTGVWNRYAMSYKLTQEHERVTRTGQNCSIALMDFDHFKNINDQYGHIAGDNVLKTAMKFFSNKLRKYDAIFRYGGEEFLFLLPATTIIEAQDLMERLRKGLKQLSISVNNKHNIHISVSIGLTSLDQDTTITDAINMADNALLKAKENGRNCICVLNNQDNYVYFYPGAGKT